MKFNLAMGVTLSSVFLAVFFYSCISSTKPSEEHGPEGFKPRIMSSTEEITKFLEKGMATKKAKLVFVKRLYNSTNKAFHQLFYIDFSRSVDTPQAHEITAAKGAQVPVISPDGKWVVYAVGDGLCEAGALPGDRSSIYLCEIQKDATPLLIADDRAFEPRFKLKQNAGKLTVIYTTKAGNYAWLGDGQTMMVEVDVSGSKPKVGTKETLFKTASFTGGLSMDEKYLVGGGGNIGFVDITGSKETGDTATDFDQACNVSMTPSSILTNTFMYLTTAGSHPKINGGKKWNTWEAIIISNSEKKVVKGFMNPTTFTVPLDTSNSSFRRAKWHHCEWSNHPYFAATTLNIRRLYGESTNSSFYQEQVYIVNVKDSTYLEIVRPESVEYSGSDDDNAGYYWPWLWVEVPTSFTEDPEWLKP